jgi:serine/threonine protein kinase
MTADARATGGVIHDRYVLNRTLAINGARTTWQGLDTTLDRNVVIETLSNTSASAHHDFLASHARHARCTHFAIAQVFDSGVDGNMAYIVHEYVEGTSLDTILTNRGPLPLREAAALAAQLSEALTAAHELNLIHGALTTACVWVLPNGRIKLTGFERSDDAIPVRYRAPEATIGPASDIYALGVISYELLTGLGGNESFAMDDDITEEWPAAVRSAITRSTDANPNVRAASPRAIARAFAPYDEPAVSAPAAPNTAVRITNANVSPAEQPTAPALRIDPTSVVAATPRDLTAYGAAVSGIEGAAVPNNGAARAPRSVAAVLRLIAIVIVLGAIFGTAAFLVFNRSSGSTTDASPEAQSERIPISRIVDFDPEGDNGQENRAKVKLAIDDDPTTSWTSEIYNSSNFGNAKSGLGLIIDLSGNRDARELVVLSGAPGWSAQILSADTVPTTRAGWGTPIAAIDEAAEEARVTLPPTSDRHVLLWFTKLPSGGRLDIREVTVLG